MARVVVVLYIFKWTRFLLCYFFCKCKRRKKKRRSVQLSNPTVFPSEWKKAVWDVGACARAGSYQRFREGIRVVGGQELPDLPPLSLPVEPVGVAQSLTVPIAGGTGVGTAQCFLGGLMLSLGPLAALFQSCSGTFFGPLRPPQQWLHRKVGWRQSLLPWTRIRRRRPLVALLALRRSLVQRLGPAQRPGRV